METTNTFTNQLLDEFEADGKKYQIRLYKEGTKYLVRVFHNDELALPYAIEATWEQFQDFPFAMGVHLTDFLIEYVKRDIRERRFEQWLEARRIVEQNKKRTTLNEKDKPENRSEG